MAQSAAKEVFANFTINFDTRPLEKGEKATNKVEKSTESATDAFRRFATVAGVAVVGAALKSFTIGLVDTMDKIDKTSRALGISAEAFQELQFAADLSGAGTEKLNMTLGIVQQKALEASRGLKDAQTNFKDLGVTVTDADGSLRSTDAILSDLADGFQKMKDPVKRTGIAMKLFGETGKAMVPLLEQGSAGLNELREEAQRLGVVFDDELIAQGAQTRDALTRLEGSFNQVKGALAVQLLPALQATAKFFRESVVPVVAAVTKGADLLQTGLVALTTLGVVFLVNNLAKLFTKANAVRLGFLALIAAIDSLVTAYKGGTSAVREFFLEWLGFDINEVIDPIVAGFQVIPQVASIVMTEAVRYFELLGNAAEKYVLGPLQSIGSYLGFDTGPRKSGEQLRREAADINASADVASFRAANEATEILDRNRSALLLERSLRQAASGATAAQLTGRDKDLLEKEAVRRLGSTQNFELAQRVAKETQSVTLAPTVNVNGAANPEATARAVRRELDRQLREAASAAD